MHITKDVVRFLLCAALFVAGMVWFFKPKPRDPEPKLPQRARPVRPTTPPRTEEQNAVASLATPFAALALALERLEQERGPALPVNLASVVRSLAGPYAALAAPLSIEPLKRAEERAAAERAEEKRRQEARARADRKPIRLGSDDPNSPFHLFVEFDRRGAAVQRIVLNKFKQADRLGRLDLKRDANGNPILGANGRPVAKELELIPAPSRDIPERQRLASHLLYHFEDTADGAAARPVDTLGQRDWDEIKVEDGDAQAHSVSFRTTVPASGVEIIKTYRLERKTYHLGLEVTVRRLGDAPVTKFRYQLTGAHGLRMEGEWYTSTFRHALIGQLEGESLWRDFQDLTEIARKEGGRPVSKDMAKGGKGFLQYAAVAVQFFASAIVVDNEGQTARDFLASARPTLESQVVVGELVKQGSKSVTLRDKDRTRADEEYTLSPVVDLTLAARPPKIGDRLAFKVVPYAGIAGDRLMAVEVLEPGKAQPLFLDDITVRVNTDPIDLSTQSEVTHKYLLYNGPVKVMQLGQLFMEEDGQRVHQVDPALVNRYTDALHLDTFTDYKSPGVMGNIASTIGFTFLIIKFTNICHAILFFLHSIIPSYGICIILLTVIVRGTMFPLSRKQAMTSMKMQELGPELKKLKEKFKDDRQAFAVAQMELFRKHGVNPLGSCWMLFLQLPIFMGLYYCLQESVHFRLATFLWIPNLAAPDMTIMWGEGVPLISRPEDYGSLIYLGPFLNLLPIVAVALMIYQQNKMMPPPADEQAAMQQKMMKYMMIFFGLLFYKVAAGLCIYFIASSLWGFAERQFLPKKKTTANEPPAGGAPAGGLLQRLRGEAPGAAADAANTNGQGNATMGNRARRRQERKKQRGNAPGSSTPETSAADTLEAGGWWANFRRRVSDWWQDLLKKASKK